MIHGSKKPNTAVEFFGVHSTQTKISYVACDGGGISKLCNLSCSVNEATVF